MTDNTEKPKYKISVNAYGGIDVEAPTKDECLEMFNNVSTIKKTSKIESALV
ncbi:MAG: hypothetical protein WC365_04325 [Candidatus Babeliales bacterium]|jgi:hypothetical protein